MAGGAGAAGGMGSPSTANNTMPSFGTPAPGSGIGQISGNTLSNMANPTGVNNGTMGGVGANANSQTLANGIQTGGLSNADYQARINQINQTFNTTGQMSPADQQFMQMARSNQAILNQVNYDQPPYQQGSAGNPGFPDPRYSSQGGTGTNFAQTMSQLGMGGMASRGGMPAPPQMQQGGPPMTYGQPNGMMQRPPMMGGFGDMIRRQAFNPMMGQAGRYAGPRSPQIFQPNIAPQTQSAAAPQNAEMDKMRQELEALRAWQTQMQGGAGGGGGNH